jgi:DNA recombination protein RmuC
VLQTGKELYGRLVGMTERVTKLGRSITTVTNDYNKFIATLETRVVPSARKMVELKVADATLEMEPLKVVENAAREITKPELLAGTQESFVELPDVTATDDRSSVDALVEADRRALSGAAHDAEDDDRTSAAG